MYIYIYIYIYISQCPGLPGGLSSASLHTGTSSWDFSHKKASLGKSLHSVTFSYDFSLRLLIWRCPRHTLFNRILLSLAVSLQVFFLDRSSDTLFYFRSPKTISIYKYSGGRQRPVYMRFRGVQISEEDDWRQS